MTEINRLLERLDVAIITRYPDSQHAAESYDALRKGIFTNASAATVGQQNLIALANSIDDGANAATVRLKISDLLGTFQVREITSQELMKTQPDRDTYSQVFQEVGDNAHPRSAWVRMQGEAFEVVQKGYVYAYPEFTILPDDLQDDTIIDETSSFESHINLNDSHPHSDSELSTEVGDQDNERRTDSP
jgi:hypothetical protein